MKKLFLIFIVLFFVSAFGAFYFLKKTDIFIKPQNYDGININEQIDEEFDKDDKMKILILNASGDISVENELRIDLTDAGYYVYSIDRISGEPDSRVEYKVSREKVFNEFLEWLGDDLLVATYEPKISETQPYDVILYIGENER